jgi:hypothetical protein
MAAARAKQGASPVPPKHVTKLTHGLSELGIYAHHVSHPSAQIAGVHPPEARSEALALVEAGLNDCEISRRLGIPRATIRDWRRPSYQKQIPAEICPRCWRGTKPIRFTPEDYATLLGFYLGDGCVSPGARTDRLRIALDAKYPLIIREAQALLARSFPSNPVGLVEAHGGTMFSVSVYSSHLTCLLPQHGAGKKHDRPIELEDWQRSIVEAEPWAFIRACIWTDGCSFVNRTNIHREQPYEYLSYEFSNMSTDIVDLFRGSCDRVGVFTRANRNPRGLWSVRINRRASVALMVEHVGAKR